ncbi:MAG: hypothetical protein QF898_05490 [SAR202 cluster bacterium]|jgi:hypothetical protein|nr:hypothetical protein [SAR202 cluster bacterium]MDP6512176.1 hypothetical protein [SAR202 cluster bacterium]MDP6714679.1 hypothetical protein [SAR202 cluster bacterium]
MSAILSEIPCPLCRVGLRVKLARSKKGKPSIALSCPVDGRHFRGFITDRAYVARFIDDLEMKI